MKNVKGLLIKTFILVLLASLCIFFACTDDKSSKTVEIQKVEFTTAVSYYDFYNGISFVDDNGKSISYTVDSSNVQFGKEGKYSVKYFVNGTEYIRYVFIYGEPKILIKANDIYYKDAVTGNFDAIIRAEDSFGLKLDYSCLTGFFYNENGQLGTGIQSLKFKTTDKFNSSIETVISVNVLEPTDSFVLKNLTVDYASPYYTVQIGNRQVKSIYYNGEKLSESCYIVNNGYFMLTPDLFKTLGCGSKKIYINFDTCYAVVDLDITDNKELAYEIVGDIGDEKFYLDDNIELPYVRLKNSSLQDAYFKYYVQPSGKEKLEVTDGLYAPEIGGDYTLYIELFRNGSKFDTVSQSFSVSHYYKKPIDLGGYIPLGVEVDLSLRTDIAGIKVVYTLTNNAGVLQINGNKLTGLKEGTATVQININNGEMITSTDVSVIDYRNSVGEVRDFSQDLDLWSTVQGVEIKNQTVSDEHVSAKEYSYKALTANGDVFLTEDLIKSAKIVGYKYLTFYSYVKENKKITVSLCDNNGQRIENAEDLLSVTHNGRWTYYSIQLSKVTDCGVLFHTDSDELNLAKTEFVGANITSYAKTVIKGGATSGKSVDLVNELLIEKMYLSTANTNYSFEYTNTGMDRTSGTDNGDYITFTRSGYYSSYGATENDVYISSEWIMAAKELGYSTIGIFVKDSNYNFLKRSADGTVQDFKKDGTAWHGSVTTFAFISLDLTSFEEGDVIIISASGEAVGISGVTFRTKDFGVPNLKI